MPTDRRAIMALTVHPDGSQTVTGWTPLSEAQQASATQDLGPAAYTSHLPAETVARLLPVVSRQAVVYQPEETPNG